MFKRPFWVAVLGELGLPDWRIARALNCTKRQVYMSHYQWLTGDEKNKRAKERISQRPERKSYLRAYRKQWSKDNAHVKKNAQRRYKFSLKKRGFKWISGQVSRLS